MMTEIASCRGGDPVALYDRHDGQHQRQHQQQQQQPQRQEEEGGGGGGGVVDRGRYWAEKRHVPHNNQSPGPAPPLLRVQVLNLRRLLHCMNNTSPTPLSGGGAAAASVEENSSNSSSSSSSSSSCLSLPPSHLIARANLAQRMLHDIHQSIMHERQLRFREIIAMEQRNDDDAGAGSGGNDGDTRQYHRNHEQKLKQEDELLQHLRGEVTEACTVAYEIANRLERRNEFLGSHRYGDGNAGDFANKAPVRDLIDLIFFDNNDLEQREDYINEHGEHLRNEDWEDEMEALIHEGEDEEQEEEEEQEEGGGSHSQPSNMHQHYRKQHHHHHHQQQQQRHFHHQHHEEAAAAAQEQESIQRIQEETLKNEISEMAHQLKQSTLRMNQTLHNQTKDLDQLEDTVTTNLTNLTHVTHDVQDHVEKTGWKKQLYAWSLFLIVVGTFVLVFTTIRLAPKRKNAFFYGADTNNNNRYIDGMKQGRKKGGEGGGGRWRFWTRNKEAQEERFDTSGGNTRRSRTYEGEPKYSYCTASDDGSRECTDPQFEHDISNDDDDVDDETHDHQEKGARGAINNGRQRRYPFHDGNKTCAADGECPAPSSYQHDNHRAYSSFSSSTNHSGGDSEASAATTAPAAEGARRLVQERKERRIAENRAKAQTVEWKVATNDESAQEDTTEETNEKGNTSNEGETATTQKDESATVDGNIALQEPAAMMDDHSESIKETDMPQEPKAMMDNISSQQPGQGDYGRRNEDKNNNNNNDNNDSRQGGDGLDFTAQDVREAAKRDSQTLLRYLSQKPEFATNRDENGWEAIHEASRAGNVACIELLVKMGGAGGGGIDVNVNSRTGHDGRGGTPLWLALNRGLSEDHPAVRVLRRYGAIAVGPDEEFPLDDAVEGRKEVKTEDPSRPAAVDGTAEENHSNVERETTDAGRMEADTKIAAEAVEEEARQAAEEARLEAERERVAREEEEARLAAETERVAREEEEVRRAAEAKAAEEACLAAERERAAREEEEARRTAEAKAAKEARLAAERDRQAREEEETRRAAETKAAEEARLAAERERAALEEEETRLAAEAKAAEEARLAAERERAAQDEEEAPRVAEAKAAEEARLAAERDRLVLEEEEARRAAEAKAAEEARLAVERDRLVREEEEARRAAEAKAAEEARLAAERDRLAREEEELASEAKAAEEARLAAERERLAREEEEARRVAEAKAAEEARLAAEIERVVREEQEARRAAEAKAAEEARRAAEAKAAEEARLAAERERAALEEEETRLAAEAKAAKEASLTAEREAAAEDARRSAAAKEAEEQFPPVTFTADDIRFAAARGDVASLTHFIKLKPEWVDTADSNGWQPIHEASRAGHYEAIKVLLDAGCDLNARTGRMRTGGTPLWWALSRNGAEHPAVRLLQENGAVSLPPHPR